MCELILYLPVYYLSYSTYLGNILKTLILRLLKKNTYSNHVYKTPH